MADWKDESSVTACENCAVFFSLLTRRNRCRACGGIFCKNCTNYPLPDQPKARACRNCAVKQHQATGSAPAPIAPEPDEPLLSLIAKSTAIGSGLNTRIVVGLFGASQTGKTALALRFVQDAFPEEWDATIEDVYQKEVHVDDSTFWLEIHDTAGMEELAESRDKPMEKCDVHVLVYSVQDRASFDAVEAFHRDILARRAGKDAVLVLMANKADAEPKAPRVVSVDDGQQLAKRLKAQYIEGSARDRTNVVEMFHGLIVCFLEATGVIESSAPASPAGSPTARAAGSPTARAAGGSAGAGAPPPIAPAAPPAIAPPAASPAGSPRAGAGVGVGGVMPSITVSGYLIKGEKGMLKSSHRRLFILEGTCLSYYDKPDGSQLGRLDLRGAAFVAGGEKCQFKLAGPHLNTDKKDKTYLLTADSQEEYDKWKFAIEEAVRNAQ